MAAARPVFGRVVLVLGAESLLADRAVAGFRTRALAETADADVSEADAGRLDASSLLELTSGSLFSSRRLLVLTDVGALVSDLHAELLGLARSCPPELAVVAVHAGGARGKGLLDKLKAAGIEVVDCPPVKAWELPQFVAAEARRLGGAVEPGAAQSLVDAVGHDLRALAAAVSQLVADADGGPIDVEQVRRYFGGRAEVTSFAVADAALAGRAGAAMEQLRWALATGVAPVLITSALASGVRGLGRLVSAGPGMRDADLAKEVGVPPWKLKSMRAQARGWDQGGLSAALRAVAIADADVKGAAEDPSFALERAVLAVTRARRS